MFTASLATKVILKTTSKKRMEIGSTFEWKAPFEMMQNSCVDHICSGIAIHLDVKESIIILLSTHYSHLMARYMWRTNTSDAR
jgi:hypothetical protein